MNRPSERVPETPANLTGAHLEAHLLEGFEPQLAMPHDDLESLHRAINERRAQQENPELLRHLRSL
jgi:hypothetical protein